VEHLGTQAFWRLRIGIGKSDTIPTEDYVLMPFSKTDKDLVLATFAKITADPNFKKLLGP
jgi:peptidyl-tRNA hydrolase